MTLQLRTVLMVTFLLALVVLATATTLAMSERRSLLAQEEYDRRVIAELLAQRSEFALGMASGHPVRFQLSWAEARSLQAAARQESAVSRLEGDTLEVVTPMVDPHGQQIATAPVDLPAARVGAEMRRKLQLAVALAVIVLLVACQRDFGKPRRGQARAGRTPQNDRGGLPVGGLTSVALARRMTGPQELRIEVDTARRGRQVAEITGTDYFQELQRRAGELRSRAAAVR